MISWLHRLRGRTVDASQDAQEEPRIERSRYRRRHSPTPQPRDPNAPQRRLQLQQKCLYERMLPGKAFISAHVNRLQHGFYASSALHESVLNNIYFVSVHFVFHPYEHRTHRFKSALIQVSIHSSDPTTHVEDKDQEKWHRPPKSHPRILKHAPELIYGAVSPENLQWNFSLSSSLGVSHAPLSATVNPAGGIRSSYKVYDMMSIQGSLRSIQHPMGPEYDIEDAMAVWTLEENLLQRSGLPREFDFVLLIHKPDDVKNVFLTVDVDAQVETWFGEYPQWYTNLSKYMPTQDYTVDFNSDIGQRFMPTHPGRGFNFADLPHPLEEYVTMPGTVYPTNDTRGNDSQGAWRPPRRFDNIISDPNALLSPTDNKAIEASPQTPQMQRPTTPPPSRGRRASQQYQPLNHNQNQSQTQNRHSWAPDTLNVRVMLEHSYPHSPDTRRYSGSPLSNLDTTRRHSIRRRRSRSGLKEYGAQQALQEIARETLEENEPRANEGTGLNGFI